MLMSDTIPCPQCGHRLGSPSGFGSTGGPVEHLKTGYVNNHWPTPLAEMVEQERPAALDRDLERLPA
jgi:hypothetical protein